MTTSATPRHRPKRQHETDVKILETIRSRRSVRKFDPDHWMTDFEINCLMEHIVLSPTAFNIQNWRFVAVRDAKLRAQIREASWGQKQITDASLLLVLCMDLMSWDKQPERYWANAPERVRQSMARKIRHFFEGDEQLQRDEGMRSCGIAAQTAMIAAKTMGYDSCPMDGFEFDRVAELVNLPADHRICMMLCIGKPLVAPYARPGQLAINEVFHWDRFPD